MADYKNFITRSYGVPFSSPKQDCPYYDVEGHLKYACKEEGNHTVNHSHQGLHLILSPDVNSPYQLKDKNTNDNFWTGNKILIPEIGVDLIGMGAIAVLMFIGIISLPIALLAIAIFAIVSYFITKDIEEKITDFINNLLQKFFAIPSRVSKIITNFILDGIEILTVIIIVYIIYMFIKEK